MNESLIPDQLQCLAAVMVRPTLTVPIAILAIGGLAMYWQSLRRSTPPSRRRIRQANSLVQMILLVTLVYAMSAVDPVREPIRALLAWTSATLLLLLTIALALVDVYNTWRLHHRSSDRFRSKARQHLQSSFSENDSQNRPKTG